MWADPLIWKQDAQEGFQGSVDVDFTVPDSEIWRLRLWQATQSQGTFVTMVVVGPPGKAGGTLQVAVAVTPLPTVATVTFPRGPTAGVGAASDDALIRYQAQYIDVLPGGKIRTVFLGSPGGGAVIIGYERITNRRIQAQYGPEATIDFDTGLIRYAEVERAPFRKVVDVG